jgi:hypothetical protein
MSKLIMLSVLVMNIALPARAASAADPRRALKRAMAACAVFNFFYVLAVAYLAVRFFKA